MELTTSRRAAGLLPAGTASTCDIGRGSLRQNGAQRHRGVLPQPSPTPAARGAGENRRYQIYRENFTPEECAELDRLEPLSAVSELCLLRILIARVLKALRKLRATLEHHYKNLVVFSHVGITMASLARFQHKRDGPPPDPFLEALAAMDTDPL